MAWGKGDTTAISQTWSSLLQKNGYDTYVSGKWHVQAPATKIFKEAKNVRLVLLIGLKF